MISGNEKRMKNFKKKVKQNSVAYKKACTKFALGAMFASLGMAVLSAGLSIGSLAVETQKNIIKENLLTEYDYHMTQSLSEMEFIKQNDDKGYIKLKNYENCDKALMVISYSCLASCVVLSFSGGAVAQKIQMPDSEENKIPVNEIFEQHFKIVIKIDLQEKYY